MVMGAFSIEVTSMVVDAAVIQRAEAHEAMLQGVVPLLMHVVVPDHILLTGKPLQKREGGREGVQQKVCVHLIQTISNKSLHLCGSSSCNMREPVGSWEDCAYCSKEDQDQ